MEYRTTIDGIEASQLEGFFEGWQTHPAPEGLLKILAGSSERIVAVDAGRVVGFITALTDGSLSAYIPLLEVLPQYRNQGVGSELVKRMLERLSSYYMIDIVCDESVAPFYEKLGMKKGNAMSIRNYANRS